MPAEAPPAPAAAPKIEAAPSAPALKSAPKVEINALDIGGGKETPPPKKGSARERMVNDLRSKADPNYKAPEEMSKLPEKKDGEDGKAAPAPEAKEGEEAPSAPKAGEDPKKAKANPWKLMEEHKAARAAAEAKLLEVEKRAIPEATWKEKEAALEASTKRLNELEEEIRFVSFKKSKEYAAMQTDYHGAWNSAMESLGEITVQSEEGGEVPMTPEDLLELVNMSDVKAKRAAIAKYGELEGLVMQHRDKIRTLANQQAAAEAKARNEGSAREKEMTARQQKEYGEVSGVIKETWSKANEEVTADPKYGTFFTPRDGDEQGNQRLAKGYEMADRAFSENPLAPGLTPEQRQSIVKRHAAVRNRSAAFGRLVYDLSQKDLKISEMQKIIDEYKGSEPDRDGSKKINVIKGGSAKNNMMDALRKLAVNR